MLVCELQNRRALGGRLRAKSDIVFALVYYPTQSRRRDMPNFRKSMAAILPAAGKQSSK
jgi:hypothetical protein